MAWGRGGAGNIQQAGDAEKRMAEDIEAAQPPQSTESSHPDASFYASSEPQEQEYAHMGRGGAGNWYSPAELNSTGTYVSNAKPQLTPSSNGASKASTLFGDPTLAPASQAALSEQELAAGHRGRGGAGNFIWRSGAEEGAKAKAEEERLKKAGKIEEKVIADVEAGLAMPGRAKVAGGVGKDKGEGWEGLERV